MIDFVSISTHGAISRSVSDVIHWELCLFLLDIALLLISQ